MADWPDSTQISTFVTEKINLLQTALMSTEIWIQLAVIILVFVLARWFLTPRLQFALVRLSTASGRVASFNQLIVTLNEFANTLVWLILQWIAIEVYIYIGQSHHLLLPVASLLSAWLLIRIASKLLNNRAASRVVASIAWSVAILNIFELLQPLLTFLDSLSLTLGSVRISPLIIIKAGLSLWLSLWLASVLATFLDRRLESSDNCLPGNAGTECKTAAPGFNYRRLYNYIFRRRYRFNGTGCIRWCTGCRSGFWFTENIFQSG